MAHENATPRPWTRDEDFILANRMIIATVCGDGISIEQDYANADLIIEAVNEIDTLRAENERLREALQPIGALAIAVLGNRMWSKAHDNDAVWGFDEALLTAGHLRLVQAALSELAQ